MVKVIPPRNTSPASHTQQVETYEQAVRRAKEEDARELEEFNRQQRRYALTDHCFEEFETEDDEECDQLDWIEQRQVVELWSTIEKYRRAIAWQETRFKRWLEVSPELKQHWKQFTDAGGISSEDFEKFCAGKMRHRVTRENKHLRLIRTKSNSTIKLIRSKHGNDAA